MFKSNPGRTDTLSSASWSAAAMSIVAAAASLAACGPAADTRSMEVTATAYTMRESETKKGNVGLTAWGDELEPGMKAIAVSRDLIGEGLDHETKVRIDGLKGTFVVRDKMHRRWKKKIDIFMGTDVDRARDWGKQEVTIHWRDTGQ